MKRAKLIMVALCVLFASMLVVGCQNPVNGGGSSSGSSGTGGGGSSSSALAPFAGTTWVLSTDSAKKFTFNANGTVEGALLTAMEGVSYTYTVENSREAIITMVMDGVEIGKFGKLVIASADATTGGKLYMFMAGSFQTTAEAGEYSKQ
ncbi:MAG: hypothetical protein IKQ66_04170 [Treponema sp.]|nr:hypothetical protein [Treponema sp.]